MTRMTATRPWFKAFDDLNELVSGNEICTRSRSYPALSGGGDGDVILQQFVSHILFLNVAFTVCY